MSVTQRVRLVIAASIIILTLGGYATYRSIQRVTQLQALQLQAEATLTTAYNLLSDTTKLLYTIDPVGPVVAEWIESTEAAGVAIERITGNPLVQGLGISRDVQAVRIGWVSASVTFAEAQEQLNQILEGGHPAIATPRGVLAMSETLRQRLATSPGTVEERSTLLFLRGLETRLQQATISLENFVSGSLESLGNEIALESNRVASRTIRITSAVVGFLVLVAVGGLLTGTHFLQQANQSLENRVARRTRSIQNLMDVSDQAIFSFGSDLKIHPVYSKRCESLFGGPVADENVAFLFFHNPQERNDFADALKLVFDGTTKADVVFDLIDREARVNNRTVYLDFRQIDPGTIMCSAQDITEQKNLQRQLEEENALRAMILAVVMNRDYFSGLLREADRLFVDLDRRMRTGGFRASEDEAESLMRTLHTFKANAAFLKMESTSLAAHQLEEQVGDQMLLQGVSGLEESVAKLRTSYYKELSQIKENLGEEWVVQEETVTIPLGRLKELEREIRGRLPANDSVLETIRELQMVPYAILQTRLKDLAEDLSSSRGKRVKVIAANGNALYLGRKEYDELSENLLHIIRNMVDHGIEHPRERERAGKSPEGHIFLDGHVGEEGIELSLSDDGRGVDLESIKAKARERNLINGEAEPSRAELLRLIFLPQFSTSPAVTTTSGRGVGLPAVRAAVRKLGGRMTLSTKEGKGTRFVIQLPKEAGALGSNES
jgi:two-component system chemotaxis sensor kinase CheA